VAVLVAVAAVAVALSVLGSPGRSSTATTPSATLPSLPAVVGTAPGGPPSAPRLEAPVGAAQLAAARTVAKAFLAGYLPYLYGRAHADRLSDVSAALRAELARQPPRITPAQHLRRPRMLALAVVGQARDRVLATATIADGGAPPYPVRLILARRAGRWVVTALPS
jgi:hypothetical protein